MIKERRQIKIFALQSFGHQNFKQTKSSRPVEIHIKLLRRSDELFNVTEPSRELRGRLHQSPTLQRISKPSLR